MSKLKKAFSDPDIDPEGTEEDAPAPAPEGLRFVKGMGVPPRSRIAGASKYDLAKMEVNDGYESTEAKDIRNITVAARSYSKRIARNGGVAPKFVARKTAEGKYALIRES